MWSQLSPYKSRLLHPIGFSSLTGGYWLPRVVFFTFYNRKRVYSIHNTCVQIKLVTIKIHKMTFFLLWLVPCHIQCDFLWVSFLLNIIFNKTWCLNIERVCARPMLATIWKQKPWPGKRTFQQIWKKPAKFKVVSFVEKSVITMNW